MKIRNAKGFHAHRAADRRRDHRHHRGDRGARPAPRPHVGQRGVGDRFAARDQQRRSRRSRRAAANGNYAVTLAALGTPPVGGGQAFISPDLATATTATATVTKSGYTVGLGVGGTAAVAGVLSCNGGAAVTSGYTAAADPVSSVDRHALLRDRQPRHDLLQPTARPSRRRGGDSGGGAFRFSKRLVRSARVRITIRALAFCRSAAVPLARDQPADILRRFRVDDICQAATVCHYERFSNICQVSLSAIVTAIHGASTLAFGCS